MEFKLGSKLRDVVTGIEGIATSRVEYLNGCIQYGIKARSENNKMPDCDYIDVNQLEFVDAGVSVVKKDTGGPQRDCPKH